MVEVKNLSFSYGDKLILKDVSFSAPHGSCVALLGVNGAGKSTLLRCLAAIVRPGGGSVTIDGHDIFKMSRSERAKNLAYVAQKSVMPRTTVYEALLLGRKPHMGWTVTARDYGICDAVLRRIAMTDYKLRFLDELSGGEAQKVMLARAFVQQPKVLLLDEPTSNLDPKNQYDMMKLVRQMAREQAITVLTAIHDLNLALRYCDSFLLLKEGALYDYGGAETITPEALQALYAIEADVMTYHGAPYALIKG